MNEHLVRRLPAGRAWPCTALLLTVLACTAPPAERPSERAAEPPAAAAPVIADPPAAAPPAVTTPATRVDAVTSDAPTDTRTKVAVAPKERRSAPASRDAPVSTPRAGVSAPATAPTARPVTAPAATPPAPPSSDENSGTRRRDIVWSSDWSAGLGLSPSALRDDARWSMLGGQGLEVISSNGLGFPTASVLRVTAEQRTTGYAFLRKTGLPIPEVGESNYYRWYFRATMPDGLEDPESHPFQDGNASSQSNWLFHVYHDAGAGRWRPQLRPSARSNAYPNDRWSGPALQKHVTYRFEVQLARTGANTFRMNARIYDEAGTLLHASDAFSNQTGAATLASNPTFTFSQLANMDGLNAGNNGIAGSPSWPFVYGYQGAIAVCRGDWCGAYRVGEGR